MASQRLEDLPNEIIFSILQAADSPVDLCKLMFSSPQCYRVAMSSPNAVFEPVVRRTIAPENFPFALAACSVPSGSSVGRPKMPQSREDEVQDLNEFINVHREQTPCKDPTEIDDVWYRLLKLALIVDHFVDVFPQHALCRLQVAISANLPQATAQGLSDATSTISSFVLSPTERARLQRALFRFERYRRIWQLARQTKSWRSVYDALQRIAREAFVQSLKGWEKEELTCVFHYLESQSEDLLDEAKQYLVDEMENITNGQALSGSLPEAPTQDVSSSNEDASAGDTNPSQSVRETSPKARRSSSVAGFHPSDQPVEIKEIEEQLPFSSTELPLGPQAHPSDSDDSMTNSQGSASASNASSRSSTSSGEGQAPSCSFPDSVQENGSSSIIESTAAPNAPVGIPTTQAATIVEPNAKSEVVFVDTQSEDVWEFSGLEMLSKEWRRGQEHIFCAMAAKGLPFMRYIATSRSRSQQLSLASSCTYSHTTELMVLFRTRHMVSIGAHEALDQYVDALGQPNAAWAWARNFPAINGARPPRDQYFHQQGLAELGLVFWDRTRLEAMGLFDLDFAQLECLPGRRARDDEPSVEERLAGRQVKWEDFQNCVYRDDGVGEFYSPDSIDY